MGGHELEVWNTLVQSIRPDIAVHEVSFWHVPVFRLQWFLEQVQYPMDVCQLIDLRDRLARELTLEARWNILSQVGSLTMNQEMGISEHVRVSKEHSASKYRS